MFGVVVGGCNIPPTYFLDEMDAAECDAIIESYNSSYKNQWEQCRYIAYVIAAINSDKIKKPTDLITFDWEKEAIQPISKEERIVREQEMLKWLANQ